MGWWQRIWRVGVENVSSDVSVSQLVVLWTRGVCSMGHCSWGIVDKCSVIQTAQVVLRRWVGGLSFNRKVSESGSCYMGVWRHCNVCGIYFSMCRWDLGLSGLIGIQPEVERCSYRVRGRGWRNGAPFQWKCSVMLSIYCHGLAPYRWSKTPLVWQTTWVALEAPSASFTMPACAYCSVLVHTCVRYTISIITTCTLIILCRILRNHTIRWNIHVLMILNKTWTATHRDLSQVRFSSFLSFHSPSFIFPLFRIRITLGLSTQVMESGKRVKDNNK